MDSRLRARFIEAEQFVRRRWMDDYYSALFAPVSIVFIIGVATVRS